MKLDVAAIGALGIVALAGSVQAGVDFESAETHDTSGIPLAVALADVDGDEIDDIIVSETGKTGVTIHLSGSDTPKYIEADDSFVALAVADLDHDSVPDIVGVHYQADFITVILDPKTDPALTKLPTDQSPMAVALGMLDSDEYPDIVVANADDDTISVFFNDGTGGFAASTDFAVGDYPVALTVADLNGDSDDDVLALNMMGSTVSVLLGSGVGLEEPPLEYVIPKDEHGAFANTSLPVAMVVGEINGDSHPDLVTASALGNTLRLHSGDGAGSFSSAGVLSTNWSDMSIVLEGEINPGDPDTELSIELKVGSESIAGIPQPLHLRDMDGDSNLDLVVSAINRRAITLFPNDGTGFGGGVNYLLESAAWSMALADIFGADARPDAVVTLPDISRVQLLKNPPFLGWPPMVENNSLLIEECSSVDGEFVADDLDGEALVFEVIGIEEAGAIIEIVEPSDPDISLDSGGIDEGTSGTITIGDLSDSLVDLPDYNVSTLTLDGTITIHGDVSVSELNPVTGTFKLHAGDSGNREHHDWNILFNVTDAGGASSQGSLHVKMTGDGSIGTCGNLILTSSGTVTISPADDTKSGDSEEQGVPDEPAGEELASGTGPAQTGDAITTGGGAFGWLLFLAGTLGLRRRGTLPPA